MTHPVQPSPPFPPYGVLTDAVQLFPLDAPWRALPPVAAVAFTAGRETGGHAGAQLIFTTVDRIVPPAETYVTGGARGGDALIGHYLAITRPRAQHVIVLPADRSQVDPWWEPFLHVPPAPGQVIRPESIVIIEMPPGTTYADRNAELVKRGSVLHGFPAYTEDDRRSRRSGSWQTIRMARRAQKMGEWHCTALPGRWGRG
jgi:hypothetical protein